MWRAAGRVFRPEQTLTALTALGLLFSRVGCIPSESNIVGTNLSQTPCQPECHTTERCVENTCIRDGIFRLTLTWNTPGDLDLGVFLPSGQVLDWRDRNAGGGSLDRDDSLSTGPENIFWSHPPPAGLYSVCVIPFAITQPTQYTLEVRLPDGTVDTRTGLVHPATVDSHCTPDSPFVTARYAITTADHSVSPTTADSGTTAYPGTLTDASATPHD